MKPLCLPPSEDERISSILNKYSLEGFLDVFVKHEVDEIAFECLTNEHLLEMGINGWEDRMVILRAVLTHSAYMQQPR